GYRATFPLVLNISGEPTYFMALKDAGGLVKKYAMVNIQKYQNVATGDSIYDCEKQYIEMLSKNGVSNEENTLLQTASGKISKIAQGVIEGNSHYYLMLEGNEDIFDVSVSNFIEIIRYEIGDTITIEYTQGNKLNTVKNIKE
ncbi:MAG: CvpA family protein, partial [Lachnospiraceae bacterium]